MGRVRVDGLPLSASTIDAIRKYIAYVPQSIPVFPGEGAEDFLMQPFAFRANRGERPDKGRVTDVLESLGLPERLLERPMAALSGGERQRLALARALLLGRQCFLLDEVSAAIDHEAREKVALVLLDDPGLTVLSVSHDEAWVARSTHVARLVDGCMESLSARSDAGAS